MKIGSALTTAWVAAVLLSVFETFWVIVLEREQPIGYFALNTGLLLGSATVIALVLSWTDDPPPWITIALACAGAGVAWGLPSALASGAGLFLLLRLHRLARRSETTPLVYGVGLAVGLGMSAIVAPRFLARVPVISDSSQIVLDVSLSLVVVVVVGVVVALCNRLAQTPFARSAPILISLAFLSCAALPYLSQGPSPVDESPTPTPASGPLVSPHVVLLVLDTVRADHLTLYGYDRPTTPRLEAFVEERPGAAVFPSIYANSNWTVPSHASLFTGLLPSEHGSHFGSGSSIDFSIGDHETLAERMQSAGYRTIGVYANPWLRIVEGMDRGFDVYGSPFVATRLPYFGELLRRRLVPGLYPGVIHAAPRGDAILANVESELLACGDQPCFVFANLIDAHSFYAAESCRGKFADWSLREQVTLLSIHDSPERTAHLMARYDEEICELDRILTEMLERLDSAGILDETWVIITSDHGEAFGDHGNTEHGSSVYNDQVWIPLLVIPPLGTTLTSSAEPGSLVDVTATIAAIAGAGPLGIGRDLRQLAESGASASIEFYGDLSKQASQNPRAADPARAVVLGGHKLVDQSGRLELFDMGLDPSERNDLAATREENVTALQDRLPKLRFAEDSPSTDNELSQEVIDQLRELGYGQ